MQKSPNKRRNGRARPKGKSRAPRQPVQNPTLQVGSGQFVPKLSRVSLRFAATSEVKVASIDQIRVSGNNVQDPLGSTGTGIPPGFFYWASMYERYRVIGSTCQVRARYCSDVKDTSTIAIAGRIILFPCNNTTTLATGSDSAAQPFAKERSITTQTPAQITSKMSSATILGQKDVLGPDRLQSTVATGPNDEWFWRITTVNDNDGSTATDIIVDLVVTYDVEFFDRQPLDRTAVTAHFERAYLENCRQILAKQELQAIAREAAKARFQDRLNEDLKGRIEFKRPGVDLSEAAHLKEIQKNIQDIEDFQKLHANVPTLRTKQPDRWLKVEIEPNATPSSRTKAPSLK